MNPSLVVIFSTVVLDAIGIGLVFPLLPRLLAEVAPGDRVASWIGAMTALYALMQFLFAPLLGALSDRLGRRPVLAVSLAGACLNYLVMAWAPQLWMLLLGRAIAGLTSANLSVATAYLTDITPEDQRARRFGLFNAMFGAGFIIGPVLGGLLGDYALRLPFAAAAALNAANLLLTLFLLPESRTPGRGRLQRADLDPLRPLRWLASMPHVLPVTGVFLLLSAAGEAYGSCWALWGQDSFQWNGLWTGLSLGAFGLCQTLAQALLPGPAVRRLGERGTIVLGLGGAGLALVVMALATEGWMVFAAMPLFALAGIGAPALQAHATRLVDAGRQGQLQGVLASAISLASIASPLGFSTLYLLVRNRWPGAVWLSVLLLYALATPLVLRLRFARSGSADAP
jgi:DHA1 family tetracycline resistance protein-like MFS transporter